LPASQESSMAEDGPAAHPSSERLQVTELPPRRRPVAIPSEPSQPTAPSPSPPQSISTVNTILKLAGYSLSARALLLLAILGAFTLAVLAMATETLIRVYILISYCVLVVLPTVWLEIRKR